MNIEIQLNDDRHCNGCSLVHNDNSCFLGYWGHAEWDEKPEIIQGVVIRPQQCIDDNDALGDVYEFHTLPSPKNRYYEDDKLLLRINSQPIVIQGLLNEYRLSNKEYDTAGWMAYLTELKISFTEIDEIDVDYLYRL